jgi:hypothetical protein
LPLWLRPTLEGGGKRFGLLRERGTIGKLCNLAFALHTLHSGSHRSQQTLWTHRLGQEIHRTQP